jgi:hypothetical protein
VLDFGGQQFFKPGHGGVSAVSTEKGAQKNPGADDSVDYP